LLTLPIADAKARFSQVVREAERGNDVVITRGPGREPVAVVIPIQRYREPGGLKLGMGAHLGPVSFSDNWSMTDQDLLGS
jgi:prevent-host-death family protein